MKFKNILFICMFTAGLYACSGSDNSSNDEGNSSEEIEELDKVDDMLEEQERKADSMLRELQKDTL